MTLFDLDENKHYFFNKENPRSKLTTKPNELSLQFDDSSLHGSDTTYDMHSFDPVHHIDLNLTCTATSDPYWVAHNITDGWLPWSLGSYRYGYIPKSAINGTMDIAGKHYTIQGQGYIEHVWGDFAFFFEGKHRKSLKKIVSIYARLLGWWINNHAVVIPKTVSLTTDNRPPGYDWCWATLDNGWSVFFGNAVFWIDDGPATGILILTKDGDDYVEFDKIRFHYRRRKYIEKYDIFYPLDLEILATRKDEQLFLQLQSTAESVETIFDFEEKKKIFGLMINQIPGVVTGHYQSNEGTIKVCGRAKLEVHRVFNRFGHNSLQLKLDLSKNHLALLSQLDSHYFAKNIDVHIQLLPTPDVKIHCARNLPPHQSDAER